MAKHLKIYTVCGLGIGSSIVLKISVGKILDQLGLEDYSLDVADVGTAQSINYDMAITNIELSQVLMGSLPEDQKYKVVPVVNFIDKEEMKSKISACLDTMREKGII